jgi:hypothetical protein
MKFASACLLAAIVNGAEIIASNDCLADEESIVWLNACRSLWYKICDDYNIKGGQACFVETFGDAEIQWFSNSIEVSYWAYEEGAGN